MMDKKLRVCVYWLLMTLLLSGCSSDRYSIREVKNYVYDNHDYLVYIASLASSLLTEENSKLYMDEEGCIKMTLGSYDKYIDLEKNISVNQEEIKELRSFFENSFVDSIYYIRDNEMISNNNGYIMMSLAGDGTYSDFIKYELLFIDSNDVSLFDNPLQYYDENGFDKRINADGESVSWVSDHRFDFLFSKKAPIRCQADLVKGTDGIWIYRAEIIFPFHYLFLFG